MVKCFWHVWYFYWRYRCWQDNIFNNPLALQYRPRVNIQWICRWVMPLLSCWILSTLLSFDTFLSRNPTRRRYVRITHWIAIPGQKSLLNWDPDPGSQFCLDIMTRGHNSTLNHDPGSPFNVPTSQFNVKSQLGVTMQRWINIQGHNSTLNYDPCGRFLGITV